MTALSTTLLTTDELIAASLRLTAVWKPLFAPDSVLAQISAAAEASCAAVVAATGRQVSSDFTEALKAADAARDAAFVTLRDLAAAGAKNPLSTPAQRDAGARIQAAIARHGTRLYRLGYTQETGKLLALFSDLRAADATADLALLGLTAVFAHLTAAQADFEKIVADKAAAEGGTPLPTVTENRPPLEHRINLLLDLLLEWHSIAPTPALTAAVGQIQEIIDSVMPAALARRTRAENQAAKPSTPAAPATPSSPGA